MIPHRSIFFLMASMTCLGFAPNPAGRHIELGFITSRLELQSTYSPELGQIAQSQPEANQLPTLKPGNQSPLVSQLQDVLKQLGHYDGPIDGTYNENTKAAVTKFQQFVGLEADGITGASTWDRLQKAQMPKVSEPSISVATPVPQPTPPAPPNPTFGSRRIWLASLAGLVTVSAIGAGLLQFAKRSNRTVAETKSQSAPAQPVMVANTSATNGLRVNSSEVHVSENGSNGHKATPATGTQTIQLDSPLPPPTDSLAVGEASVLSQFKAESDSLAVGDTALLPQSSEEPNSAGESDLAIEETTRLAKINIVDELLKELQSPDRNKRSKAIWELGQHGASQAVQPLVDLMIDSDSKQRSLILAALSEIGIRTLKPLNRALAVSLQDESPEVSKNAIRDLTRIYDLVAQVSQLLRHATTDPDAEVQETARWALNQVSRIRTAAGIDTPLTFEPPGSSQENLPG